MKKNLKKLTLAHETIRTLDAADLNVSGAKPPLTYTACADTDGCSPSKAVGCTLNSHYLVC